MKNGTVSPIDNRDYWTPRQELNRPENTSLSVIFIAGCRIFYEDKSRDVIFPALREYNHEADPGLYINTDARARPLACVDHSEVCTHDEKTCLPAFEETAGSIPRDEAAQYEFVRLAMRKSNTYHSIRYGLGSALNASTLIADLISKKPVDGDWSQWMIESRSLFRTSLARIQFDALDIAMGIGSEDGHYQNDTASWIKDGALCGIYKCKLPKGYKNMDKTATILTLLLPIILLLLHIDTGVKFDADKKDHFDDNWIVLDLLLAYLLIGIGKLKGIVWPKSKKTQPQINGSVQAPNTQAPNTQALNITASPAVPVANGTVPAAQPPATPSSPTFSLGTSGSATSQTLNSPQQQQNAASPATSAQVSNTP